MWSNWFLKIITFFCTSKNILMFKIFSESYSPIHSQSFWLKFKNDQISVHQPPGNPPLLQHDGELFCGKLLVASFETLCFLLLLFITRISRHVLFFKSSIEMDWNVFSLSITLCFGARRDIEPQILKEIKDLFWC